VYTPSPSPTTLPSDAPAILEIDLNDRTLHGPGPVNVRVLTNPPVTTVTLRAFGREISVPKTGDGQFSLDGQLPSIPFFMRRTYDVDFIASVPDGRTAKVTLPITIR
jgi:hypothetical protein